jgi:hypothetical protein
MRVADPIDEIAQQGFGNVILGTGHRIFAYRNIKLALSNGLQFALAVSGVVDDLEVLSLSLAVVNSFEDCVSRTDEHGLPEKQWGVPIGIRRDVVNGEPVDVGHGWAFISSQASNA